MYLHFRSVHFWQKEIGGKAGCKMLVKLTTVAQLLGTRKAIQIFFC